MILCFQVGDKYLFGRLANTIFIFFLGALDTNTIHIVPKNKINESVVKKAPMKILNQPFETTFRLQVSYTEACVS